MKAQITTPMFIALLPVFSFKLGCHFGQALCEFVATWIRGED